MAATLKPYLEAVRHSLTAAMCIQNFDSQVGIIIIQIKCIDMIAMIANCNFLFIHKFNSVIHNTLVIYLSICKRIVNDFYDFI